MAGASARTERHALHAFIAVQTAAAATWLFIGRRQWFTADEWSFLAGRDGGNLDDLLRPHNEHWVTLPILVYRGLWQLVGLRSYVAYLVPVIAAHLVVAALLRVVMRRSGVHPWIATAAASAFALFGAGAYNIIFPFQIGFTGALALGLGALVIADRDGPLVRADVGGVICCVAALMSAGIAVVLVACVALAVLVRRGLRVAAAYAVPPAAIYLAWYVTQAEGAAQRSGTAGDVVRFARLNLRFTFDALGAAASGAVVLAMVLVIGLVLAVRDRPREVRRRLAAPLCLLVGAVAFALFTGLGRAGRYGGPGMGADAGRFVGVTAALLLPALAVAATAIAMRWRWSVVPLALLFVVAVPLNVRDAHRVVERNEPLLLGYRDLMLVIADLPIARELPRSLQPDRRYAPSVTIGWLLDGVDSGRIPPPVGRSDLNLTSLVAGLGLRQVEADTEGLGCEPLGADLQPVSAGQLLAARAGPCRWMSARPRRRRRAWWISTSCLGRR